MVPTLVDAQTGVASRRLSEVRPATTLPADPVLAAVGLPPLRWRLEQDSVRAMLVHVGALPTDVATQSVNNVVFTAMVADSPATVTLELTRMNTPRLTGLDITWSAPATPIEALPLFNRLLRRVDSATAGPHIVREGPRHHQDTVASLPTGTGLIARHFVYWGLGRRLEPDRTMTMLPDGTIRLQVAPNTILRERAETGDHIALVLRYTTSPSLDEVNAESLSSPAFLNQDLCLSDLPFYKRLHGTLVTFHINAEGAVRSIDAMYSLAYADRVSRADVDAALLQWASTCPIIPGVVSRVRVATRLEASLSGWVRGAGIR